MAGPQVDDFLFEDENEDKFGVHGITARQVFELLENDSVILKNRRDRRGLYLMIGTDSSGRCIAVPIEQTHNPGLWRPITAWYCKDAEESRLKG